MSESMAGVTFLAFGNGSPDVFSTFAAMKTHSGSLAVGELIGAAGFITAVVAGSMALVRPFKVARKSFVRDVGFFIVAASFSMVFLADGHLHLWECAVMVGFYVFYVVTVVFWHWYLSRKRRQNYREAAARGHFQVPGSEETEIEPYLDDDEEVAPGESNRLSRGASADDFANLERGGSPTVRAMDEDEDDETREHYMAEISSNMRVSRPRHGERRNTINPIRPSLVGALEFRAVLSSLQKSRNIQTIPINLRRYSDDPTFTMAQLQDQISSTLAPESSQDDLTAHDVLSGSARPSLEVDRSAINRVRAVSANDASGLRLDPNVFQRPAIPNIGLSSATPPGTAGLPNAGNPAAGGRAVEGSSNLSTPALSLSPVPDDFGYFAMSPSAISYMEQSSPSNHLAPPNNGLSGTPEHRTAGYLDIPGLPNSGPPTLSIPKSPRFMTPMYSGTRSSSPASPFPEYFDDPNFKPLSRAPSLRLPPPSVGSESTYHQRIFGEPEDNPVKWWPYRFLPPPQVLTSTLFPTLYSWKNKNIWEKLLGIVAAPSVLLLSITLPIVESEKEDDDIADPGLAHFPRTPDTDNSRSRSATIAVPPPESPLVDAAEGTDGGLKLPQNQANSVDRSRDLPSIITSEGVSEMPTPSPHLHRKSRPPPARHHSTLSRPVTPDSTKALPSSPKEWNRWLVATQTFTAPLFIVIIVWANTDPDLSTRNLLLPILYSLISSLIVLALLLFTTSASTAPRYRYLLCFVGFIVSIAWISTIANEVVGVLKAFGVILGISDAILGLTIFAVGNSLGDLVADMTVAKLGYPVMALSACFGGPMLNILLGIGLSGLYMTMKGSKGWQERHPTSPVKYKPYQLDVSGTLVISGVTLLVTLLGLLVVVPLNGWKMDRRIGWGLLALWTASTIGNVVVEILGWGKEDPFQVF